MNNTFKINKSWLASLWATLLIASTIVSCGSPQQMQQVSDAEFNFSERKTYALTGGDTDEAGLSGFQRDSFRTFFDSAVNELLSKRGLSEFGENGTDSADYIIRYILRDRLIITVLEPESKRLIWRGQSDTGLSGATLSLSAVTALVEQAINGFPPNN